MELEKIENENRISELTEIETDNLFRSIVMGQDVTEWIDTSKGKFKVKFPRARDLEKIGKLTAMRLGGIPVASFEKNIYEFIENLGKYAKFDEDNKMKYKKDICEVGMGLVNYIDDVRKKLCMKDEVALEVSLDVLRGQLIESRIIDKEDVSNVQSEN